MSRVAYWVAYTQKKPKTGKFSFFVSGFSDDDELVQTQHGQADFDTEDEAVEAARIEKHRYAPTPFSIAGVADTEAEMEEVFQDCEVEFAVALKASDDEKAVLAEAAEIVIRVPMVNGPQLWRGFEWVDSVDVARLLRACAK